MTPAAVRCSSVLEHGTESDGMCGHVRAGGRDDVRTCYLKESLQRDPNIASFAYSYAPPYLHRDWPEVRAQPP